MLRFDAYSATSIGVKSDDFFQILADASGGLSAFDKVTQGRGYHQFGERIGVRDSTGVEWGSVMWGGRQADRVMIEVKGERTPAAVEALRQRFEHRCTRVDSCADFDAPGAFSSLYRQCRQVKKAHRIIGGKAGDWEDYPEKGRTLYLGSKSSVSRVRLYEKGLQPDYAHLNRPNLVRLEAQIRPAKDAKAQFSRLSAHEVWGASRWTRDLAALALREHVDPHPAGTIYRLDDDDRAIRWMCKQYAGPLLGMLSDLGDWSCVGETLGEIIKAQKQGRM